MHETDKLQRNLPIFDATEEKGAIETQKQDRWQPVFVSYLSGY